LYQIQTNWEEKRMKTGTSRFTIMIMAVLLSLALAVPVFAVPDDSIDSQHITEADGTSGQDTNSGTGIKTGHIQDGAVTDSKISGIISASKLEKYANVVVVARSGGDFTDPVAAVNSITDASGNNPYLVKIMPGIYDLTGSVISMKEFVDIEGSGENMTVIKTGRHGGVLIGANNAEVRSVTIMNTGPGLQPSGIYNWNVSPKISNITVISYGGSQNFGIINSGNSAPVITNVTVLVETTDSSSSGIGIYMDNSSPAIDNSTVNVYGSIGTNNIGLMIRSSSPSVSNVSVNVLGSTSVRNEAIEVVDSTTTYSNPLLTNVTIEATGSASNYGIWSTTMGVITINRSTISGEPYSLFVYYRSTFKIGSSQLLGLIDNGGGIMQCYGVYDENYAQVTCP